MEVVGIEMKTLFIFEFWGKDAQGPTKAVTLANSYEDALSRFNIDPDILKNPVRLLSVSGIPIDQLSVSFYYV